MPLVGVITRKESSTTATPGTARERLLDMELETSIGEGSRRS